MQEAGSRSQARLEGGDRTLTRPGESGWRPDHEPVEKGGHLNELGGIDHIEATLEGGHSNRVPEAKIEGGGRTEAKLEGGGRSEAAIVGEGHRLARGHLVEIVEGGHS